MVRFYKARALMVILVKEDFSGKKGRNP